MYKYYITNYVYSAEVVSLVEVSSVSTVGSVSIIGSASMTSSTGSTGFSGSGTSIALPQFEQNATPLGTLAPHEQTTKSSNCNNCEFKLSILALDFLISSINDVNSSIVLVSP